MADIADTDRNGGMGVDGAKDGGADCGDNTVESKQPTVAHFMEWLEDNKRVLRTFARGLAFGAAGTIVYVLYRAVKTTPGISQFKTAVRPRCNLIRTRTLAHARRFRGAVLHASSLKRAPLRTASACRGLHLHWE